MDDLRQMQIMLTDMLESYHEFCVENSLVYYVVDGTALGAARHRGFIPWDDDIDVGMPRPDYEKFIKLYSKINRNKRYILETPYSDKSATAFPYSKLYDTNTTMIERTSPPIVRGIFIDIFPLDGVGNNMNSLQYVSKIEKNMILRDRLITSIGSNTSFIKRILSKNKQKFMRIFYPPQKVTKKINRLAQKNDYEKSAYIGNLIARKAKKGIMDKSIFGKPKEYKFENISIYGPADIDTYLKKLYGNWRQLPPKEKQITHHNYYLDLSTPYHESASSINAL